jgi:hypothetical protein
MGFYPEFRDLTRYRGRKCLSLYPSMRFTQMEVRSRHPQANLQTTDSVAYWGFALGMAVENPLVLLRARDCNGQPDPLLSGECPISGIL